jgi:8-oxo-dGTP diphosphatase
MVHARPHPPIKHEALEYREVVAALLVDNLGRFLLQQRDDKPGIVSPGKVGLFGGHREGAESFLECVVREVHEEISYLVPAGGFEHIASFEGSDIEVTGRRVRAEFFVARDIAARALVITEGELLIVEPNALSQIENKLSPLTQFAIKTLCKEGSGVAQAHAWQSHRHRNKNK